MLVNKITNSAKKGSTKKPLSKKTLVVTKKNTTKKQSVDTKKGLKGKEQKTIKRILISQPKPESEKSPYFEIAKKHNIEIDFHSFIRVEGITGKVFRDQRINLQNYNAVILSSRNAVEHYFRIRKELRLPIQDETKYFCMSESVALFLQNFITYRKRKIFFVNDNMVELCLLIATQHKDNKFLFPYSNIEYNEALICLNQHCIDYKIAYMYKVLSNDLKPIFKTKQYDMICFFTKGGVRSLFDNFPKYQQKDCLIGVHGHNAIKEAEHVGLQVNIQTPQGIFKSMSDALDHFLNQYKKSK